MEAQTVTWLVFLALINHVSTNDPRNPFKVEPGGLLATEGSCAEIKCQVTRDVDDHPAYWFWMKDRQWVESDKDFTSTVIYSTNILTHPVSPDFANRVKYIGSSSSRWMNSYSAGSKPLCSILICDLRSSDSGKYSLRIVGRDRWLSEEVTLNVEENRCPLTFEEPAVVVESELVTLTCSTSSSCPSRPHIQDVTQIDRTQVTGSHQDKERTITTFSFIASWEDDGRVFSCQTQNMDKYLIRNITVTVKYSPKHVKVQANPDLDVKENVLLTLSCSAESNPPVSSVTWRKTTDGREEIIQQTQTQTFRVNSASLSDSGLYSCEATNDIGSGKSHPAEVKVRYPPTEPILSMRSEVTESQTITINCTAESFPQSTLTLMRINSNRRSLITTENIFYSRPLNTLYYKFNVTSADAGWYVCRAQNTEVYKDSEQQELVVKYPSTEPKLSMRSEVTEGQTITINCTAESFPQSTLTLRRIDTNHQHLKVTENNHHSRPINSLYHTFTVTSADAGLYFCRAQNTKGAKDSKKKELVVKSTGNYLHILMFLVPALFVLMIIIVIIVVLRFRKKKSIQQGTTNTESPSGFLGWCNGTRRRSLTNENVSVEPLRSRDDLLSEQLRRPEAQRRQPLPDSTPPTDINAVYSILNLPQAASAQNPTRQKAGNTEEDSVNYAPLQFKKKIKKKQRKVETDSVYAMVSNQTQV